jgi:predicted RNA-binding protein YlxR (DUF448 family)
MAKTPVRTCIACRTSDEKADLVRVVRSSEGAITVDLTGKKPGRGAYVCRKAECIETAFKRKGFDRALRTVVSGELKDELLRTVNGQ